MADSSSQQQQQVSNPQAGDGSEGFNLTPAQILARNSAFIQPGLTPSDFYTQLSPQEEIAFRQWVTNSGVDFNPNDPTPDYDMRGFFRALQAGDPRAVQAIDPNDGQIHEPDYWKTPLDLTFSRQSKFANQNAPAWNSQDQLVTPSGHVVFDDRLHKYYPMTDQTTKNNARALGAAGVQSASDSGADSRPNPFAQFDNPALGSGTPTQGTEIAPPNPFSQFGGGIVSGSPEGEPSFWAQLGDAVNNQVAETVNNLQSEQDKITDPAKYGLTPAQAAMQDPMITGFGLGAGGENAAKGIARGVTSAVSRAARVVGNQFPSATERALGLINGIGDAGASNNYIGGMIRNAIEGNFDQLSGARRAIAEPAWEAATEGTDEAAKSASDDYQKYLDGLIPQEGNLTKYSPQQLSMLQDTEAATQGRNMEGLDTERRRLRNIASGTLEGYDATQQTLAGQLADHLQSDMNKYAPAYGNYLQQYAQASRPLDPFSTLAGKKSMADVNQFSDMPKTDVSTLPDTFFKTPQSYQNLQQMVGDPQQVTAMGRDYVANKIYNMTNGKSAGSAATAIRNWMNSPSGEWLSQEPDIKGAVQDLQKRLAQIPRDRALVGGGAAAAALIYYRHSVWGLRSLLNAASGGG